MNKSPLYKDHNWLKNKYEETKSIYKVAKICGFSYRTIHSWLIKFGIERIGRINYVHSNETREKISKSSKGKKPMLGKKHSDRTKMIMSESRKGSGNGNWKGGVTKNIRRFRRSKEYINWRNGVIELAKGACQECGRKMPLEAHHKISLKENFSLALDLNNGKASCHDCHVEADRRNRKCKKAI